MVCTHRVVSFSDVIRKNNICINDENDDRKAQTSNLMSMSPLWSSKSSKASKSFAPNIKIKKHQSYRDSDSTSMSADSPLSHNSMSHSSVSQVIFCF